MPIWPLERLFESPARIEERMRDEAAASKLEHRGDEGDPPIFRCRVCGLEAAERSYCPACLADTMEPVLAPR